MRFLVYWFRILTDTWLTGSVDRVAGHTGSHSDCTTPFFLLVLYIVVTQILAAGTLISAIFNLPVSNVQLQKL